MDLRLYNRFLKNDLARILAKDAGDDDFIESDEEVDPELMAEKVYEDVEEAREGTGISILFLTEGAN